MGKLSDSAKERLEAKFQNDDYFVGPEDLAREVAEALGLDNVPGRQVPASESPTRGDVPPFSGTTSVPDDRATKETKANLKKYEAAVEKRSKARGEEVLPGASGVTKEDVVGTKGTEADQETEVGTEGPIYPKDSVEAKSTGRKGK